MHTIGRLVDSVSCFLKLIRWPNLLIIVLAMFLVRHKIILPTLAQGSIEIISSPFTFVLLILTVLMIAAGGNIINDITDIEVDKINKPKRQIVGRLISLQSAWIMYWITLIVGIALASWIAYTIHQIFFAVLIVLIAGLMWFYSKSYQCIPLLGNFIVAFSSAFTLFIVWVLDFFIVLSKPGIFHTVRILMPTITGLLMAYTLFAALSSLLRELVKDIEDVEGDKVQGCKTLAVVLDLKQSKNIAVSIAVILLTMMGFWQFILIELQMDAAAYALIPASVITIVTIIRLALAKIKKHYTQASSFIKLTMLLGILSMIFLP